MENAYILGGLRSYVGVVNGMYRHIPAEVLGAEVLKQVLEKYQLKETEISFDVRLKPELL
mgnify:CR=1 FL=1